MAGQPEDARSIEARYITNVRYLYQLAIAENSNSQMALSAFEALVYIGGYWLFNSPQKTTDPDWKPEPDALVSVPMWVVLSLASAWNAYRDAPSLKTFGEVLGIEGGGQGKQPAMKASMKKHRDLRLTLEVHKRRVESGLSLEKAYAAVAESNGTSENIVRRAWKLHGRKLSKP